MGRKIDWLNHGLEFFVVFIGILIAFQLNKCSDNQTKRELIQNHLASITLECEENQVELAKYIAQCEHQLKICDSLLEEIAAQATPISIRNHATNLLDLRNVDLVTNAYEVLAQSGDIRFLSDYAKKKEIISLYDSFEQVEQVNNSLQKLYDNHYYPYLKTNFDLVNWYNILAASDEERQLYYSKEFSNIVSTYRYLLLVKQRVYVEQEERLVGYLTK